MQPTISLIAPGALHHMMSKGEAIDLIDVRSAAEFADGHAAGAVNLPAEQANVAAVAARLGSAAGRSRPLYLICASGLRAENAARGLRSQGLSNLVLVDGGTVAWKENGFPVRRKTRLLSLERQTQIALGVLILLMLAKGSLLHPLFYALVALLGVGLVVAGVTARCGLSALLARMPWNRPPTNGVSQTG